MKRAATWLRIAAAVGVACAALPAMALAGDGDDNREHHEQMQQPMPGKDSHAPEMHGGHPSGREASPWRACRFLRCVAAVLAIIHVLLATWVFQDIRKRGEGHGIFIILVLLAGLPAAILYALVRLGDLKKV